jgi:hypothetical protein
MTTELISIFTGEIAGQLVLVFNARNLAIQFPGGAP